jgi:hypothetical protein
MPVEFLTDAQVAAYGRFAGPPTRAQLERFFFLHDEDRRRVAGRPRLALTAARKLQRIEHRSARGRATGDHRRQEPRQELADLAIADRERGGGGTQSTSSSPTPTARISTRMPAASVLSPSVTRRDRRR